MTNRRVPVLMALICALGVAGIVTVRAATPRVLTADDYVAIQQLYAAYAHALDTGQGEAFASTFVADGEFTRGRGPGQSTQTRIPIRGHDALKAMASHGGSRHFVANLLITPTAEGAKGSCYLLLLDVHSVPAKWLETAIYDDTLVKTPAGWKFSKRVVWRDDDDDSPFKPWQAAASDSPVNLPAPGPARSGVGPTDPKALKILATAAILGPLNAVKQRAERAIGSPIDIEYGSARGNLQRDILAGEQFDVALLLPDVDKLLRARGLLAPGSAEIALDPIAIGLRGDVPSPKVGSEEDLRRTLLSAKSVNYAPTGAALMTVRKVLDSLGVAGQIHDSSTSSVKVSLGPGEYEINLFPQSEVLSRRDLGRNLGPVLPSLQVPAVIEAVIGRRARHPEAAHNMIKFLQGPSIDVALREDGMVKANAH